MSVSFVLGVNGPWTGMLHFPKSPQRGVRENLVCVVLCIAKAVLRQRYPKPLCIGQLFNSLIESLVVSGKAKRKW